MRSPCILDGRDDLVGDVLSHEVAFWDMAGVGMTLSARLWADNSDLAAETLAHPFVCRLSDGSLAREIFASYVAQDAFFLESFARVYAPRRPIHEVM